MGAQRVLQAAVAVVAFAGVADAKPRERVAVIDLGPKGSGHGPDDGPTIRKAIAGKLVAGGFDPVAGDGLEDALAGESSDADDVLLAAAMAEAQRAFGALDCTAAVTAANQAIGLAAARQAAGIAVPELPRATAYVVLCADRANNVDAAMKAVAKFRAAGGGNDVPADVLKKYPEMDTVLDRELVPIEITTDVAGAEVWIDFQRAGKAPLTVTLPAGEHVIGVAAGTKRGWAAGTAIAAQNKLAVPTTDRAGKWSEVAKRIASWNGQRPTPAELGWVMAKTQTRIALIRRGNGLEAFGRLALAEPPHKLGDEDSIPLGEVQRAVALLDDRVNTWKDRAPDPDQPLLVEDGKPRDREGKLKDPPTKWWVYATVIGAVAAGAAIVFATESGSDRQRVELHVP
jgi:hypothetical protein